MASDKLNQVVALIKAGNKPAALPILKEIIQANPQDENAWLWLYSCMDTSEQKKICLQKALEINPGNQQAQRALQNLTGLIPQPAQQIMPLNSVPTSSISKSESKKNHKRPYWFFILSAAGFLCIVVLIMIRPILNPLTIVHPNARSIAGTENMELLWNKDIKIETFYTLYVQFFKPNERSVVFWNSNFLNSLDILTGEVLWKTAVPSIETIRLFENKFFLTNQDTSLERAPSFNIKSTECSSYFGTTALLSYNAITGEKIWGYSYEGAYSQDMFFDEKNIYLQGSNDHGSSRSIIQVEKNTGNVISINCNRWPNKNIIPNHPANKGGMSSTYIPIEEMKDMQRLNWDYYFIVEDNKLVLLNKITKSPIAFIEFSGEKLDRLEVDIVNQKNIIMIYLRDSQQLFSFRLSP